MRRRLRDVRITGPRGFDGRKRPVLVGGQRQSSQGRGAERGPNRGTARTEAFAESRVKRSIWRSTGSLPMRSLVLIPLLFGAAGCMKETHQASPPLTDAEATRVAERAEATFTTGNLKAIMAQYADNAVMVDAAAPNPSADRKVTTGWASTFVSMKPGDYRVIDRHIQLIGNDAFISTGVE